MQLVQPLGRLMSKVFRQAPLLPTALRASLLDGASAGGARSPPSPHHAMSPFAPRSTRRPGTLLLSRCTIARASIAAPPTCRGGLSREAAAREQLFFDARVGVVDRVREHRHGPVRRDFAVKRQRVHVEARGPARHVAIRRSTNGAGYSQFQDVSRSCSGGASDRRSPGERDRHDERGPHGRWRRSLRQWFVSVKNCTRYSDRPSLANTGWPVLSGERGARSSPEPPKRLTRAGSLPESELRGRRMPGPRSAPSARPGRTRASARRARPQGSSCSDRGAGGRRGSSRSSPPGRAGQSLDRLTADEHDPVVVDPLGLQGGSRRASEALAPITLGQATDAQPCPEALSRNEMYRIDRPSALTRGHVTSAPSSKSCRARPSTMLWTKIWLVVSRFDTK